MKQNMLETERLYLRQWQESDLPEFAKMNADERVMEFFPTILTVENSDKFARENQHSLDNSGIGLFAVEVKNGEPFIGFIGLAIPKFTAHFTPCVEIGWRLAFPHWGKGYATEGANAILKYAFNIIGLQEIVSFTSTVNRRSQAVMRKIGMVNNPSDNFLHPSSLIPDGNILKKHVLYRRNKDSYE